MSDAIHSPTVAAEYLALEDLTGTFERLFQALNHLDPRHRGPPGQDPGKRRRTNELLGGLVAQLQEGR